MFPEDKAGTSVRMLPERLHQYFLCLGLIFMFLREIAIFLASKDKYPVLPAVVPSCMHTCKSLAAGVLAVVVELTHHIAFLLSNIYTHLLYII
jgi:hypothetical protein